MRREFDHVGMPTKNVCQGERFVAKTRVWVTDPQLHPFKVEWLRYEEDSPVSDEMKENCHIAYKVDSIEEECRGMEVLIEPFHSVANHRVGFFRTGDGVIIELMEY